ncbi:hypothetical protein M2427_005224 [Bradyrhizobium sp. BR13661]|jgi:hypothetical protein|nr:hypothetical protein [Bradyrhizobium sp. BR13661]
MSYGFNAVLTEVSSSNDAVSNPSCDQPPTCDGAQSTR